MDSDSETIRRYHEQGYLILRNFLSEMDLKAIEAEIDRISRLNVSRFAEGHLFFAKTTQIIQQIEHLEQYSRFFADMMRTDRHILDVVKSIFDAEAISNNVSFMAKPAHVGEVVPYHQDNAYYGYVPDDALSVWIALDDSTQENGCLRVIPGSHKKGLVRHATTGVRGISFGVADPVEPKRDGEIAVTLNRGDTSLHHCGTFHASSSNRSNRSRRGLILFYHSAKCRVDDTLLRDYHSARDDMVAVSSDGPDT